MDKRRILILTYTDLNRDPIVINQIDWLKGDYDLHVVCRKPNGAQGVSYFILKNSGFIARNLRLVYLKFGLYRKFTWTKARKELVNQLNGIRFDLIIVHHLNLLPAAFEIDPAAKVLFYAHEYYMHMYDHSLFWKFFIKKYFLWLASNYIHRCDYLITVNESIKDFYERDYKIKGDFIQNRIPFEDLEPKKVNPESIRIIHHGLAGTNRRLELIVKLAEYLDDRFTLTLVLQSNGIINDLYILKLKWLARKIKKIIFRELVPIKEVPRMGNEFDIGIFFLPPTTLNIKYNLANKIFQFIQSRLMLVVSPLPEIGKIVGENNLGIVAENFDPAGLAGKLNKLSAEDIYQFKCNSHSAAATYASEPNRIKFGKIVRDILTINDGSFYKTAPEQKKKLLIFTYTDIRNDAIVLKQIDAFRNEYSITVICKKSNNIEGVRFVEYPKQDFFIRNAKLLLIKTGMTEKYLWDRINTGLIKKVSGEYYHLIVVHHIKLLPLAFGIAPKTRILFYAHEFYPAMYDHSLVWRLFIKKFFNAIGNKYIPLCDYTVTVNESIEKLYEEKYKIKAGYIHNLTQYHNIEPGKVNPEKIKILHHGLASTSRKLELMIYLMKYLDERFTMTLVLQTNSIINDLYILKLKLLAIGNKRIEFKPLVGYDEIVKMGNEYDIGIFIMPPTTINEIYSLGHKIFQYIQSRLMLVISPLPEMKNLLDKYNLGVCMDDFDIKKLAGRMNKLKIEEIELYKKQSHICAPALGVETEKEKLSSIVYRIINREPI